MRSAAVVCLVLALAGCAGQASARQLTQTMSPSPMMGSMMSPSPMTGSGSMMGSMGSSSNTTLAQTLALYPELSTLLTLVKASNLSGAATDPSTNVTLFAPNNQAFSYLLAMLNISETTLLNSTYLLNTVLDTHVVPIAKSSMEFTPGQVLPTLNGNTTLTILINGTGIQVQAPMSTATVLQPNIMAGPSYVHIIDTVLLPETY